jgi:uncharacterized repeat protein (TIGR03803 family)
LLCAATAIALPAQTFTTLHSFDGTDGDAPSAALIQAGNGNLYGTTVSGNNGTVFKITPSGTLTTLYTFCSQSGCTDGSGPEGGLVQATNGDFYGTTLLGGVTNNGTVFKITPSGKVTTLYSFCSQSGCTDGKNPSAGLVRATNGDFYGTTGYGGANCFNYTPTGCGTVFKITPSGTLTTLYTASARKAASIVRTANTPPRGWSRAPVATSMGQPRMAGPSVATLARSSK